MCAFNFAIFVKFENSQCPPASAAKTIKSPQIMLSQATGSKHYFTSNVSTILLSEPSLHKTSKDVIQNLLAWQYL